MNVDRKGIGEDPSFEAALARLKAEMEAACMGDGEWSGQVAGAVREALSFAADHPSVARVLVSDAIAGGEAEFTRFDRMLEHFAARLRAGRGELPDRELLPELTERALVGGVASLIAQRIANGEPTELPTVATEAIQFVLTPYLGAEEARAVASQFD